MTITATCSACQQQYRLGDDWAGKTATCKKCGHSMQIPPLGQPQGKAGTPPTPLAAGSTSHSTATVRSGGKCPICDSPWDASGQTCSVCGYSVSASRHLTATPAAPAPKAAGRGTKQKSEAASKEGTARSQLAARLLIIGGIAVVALLVAGAVGMAVSNVLQERARLAAKERLNEMMVKLREARDASRVQNIDFDAVDLKAVVKDYAVKFAAELPYVPEYIQELEGKDTALAEDKRRWIITLLNSLPANADLTPLKEIPAKSFAHEAAAKKLAGATPGG